MLPYYMSIFSPVKLTHNESIGPVVQNIYLGGTAKS